MKLQKYKENSGSAFSLLIHNLYVCNTTKTVDNHYSTNKNQLHENRNRFRAPTLWLSVTKQLLDSLTRNKIKEILRLGQPVSNLNFFNNFLDLNNMMPMENDSDFLWSSTKRWKVKKCSRNRWTIGNLGRFMWMKWLKIFIFMHFNCCISIQMWLNRSMIYHVIYFHVVST